MALGVNKQPPCLTAGRATTWALLVLACAGTCISVPGTPPPGWPSGYWDKFTKTPEFVGFTETPEPIELTYKLNGRPIIGILSQDLFQGLKTTNPQHKSYIASSYVKFYESGGARVVPILINQPYGYYKNIVNSVNGIVFPGGTASITNSSGYGQAGRVLYDLILEANTAGRHMPLLATCVGFEMLMLLAGNTNDKMKVLTSCKDSNVAHPLNLTQAWNTSRLLGDVSDDVIIPLTTMDITSNFHNVCVTINKFLSLDIYKEFDILSTNHDTLGDEYISTVEHKTYPIWGTQWRPEDNQFEWKYSSIPHFPEAIRIAQYISTFFIDHSRQNNNTFVNETEEASHLVNNQQYYLFN